MESFDYCEQLLIKRLKNNYEQLTFQPAVNYNTHAHKDSYLATLAKMLTHDLLPSTAKGWLHQQ